VQIANDRNKGEVRQALSDCEAVVNAIGGGTLRHNDVESATTAIAVAAAEETGVQRYIAMSAGMVVLDWFLFKYVIRPLIFRNIYAEHLRVEEIVRASGLAWTIVRPPKLTNASPMGYAASVERQPQLFSAARADVASFIADELRDKKYLRKEVFVASCRGPRRAEGMPFAGS
jgi:hypothetical protein